jgi:integrase
VFVTIALGRRGVPQRFTPPAHLRCPADSILANDTLLPASWLLAKDRVPGKVVAQLMGHANVDTTLNVYTQVLDGSVRDAVEKVGSELFTIVHKLVKPEGAGSR